MKTSEIKIQRKSNLFKIILGIAALATTIFILALILIIRALPSPQSISRMLKSTSIRQTQQKSLTQAGQQPTALEKTDPLKPNTDIPLNQNESKENYDLNPNQKNGVEIITRLMNEDSNDLRVCENLGRTKFYEIKNSENPESGFDDFLTDTQRNDSVAETFRYPIKVIFQDEALSPLMHEILDVQTSNLNEQEKESFLNKVEFYRKAVQAATTLYAKKEKFESIANRAEHLAIVAKIAAKKPELLNDPRLRNFCEDLEKSLKDELPVDIMEERKEIINLIKYAGLTTQDLNFDPSAFIKFKINTSTKGINFTLTSNPPQNPKTK